MKPYELTGMICMEKACSDGTYRGRLLCETDRLTAQEEAVKDKILPQDAMAFFYAWNWSGEEKYKKEMDLLATDITAEKVPLEQLPFMTAYDTAFRKKEHYNEIAERFCGLTDLNGDELIALIHTVEEMSEEIYEYYRKLRDLCKELVRKSLGDPASFCFTGSESVKLAYCVLKACVLKILPAEKYCAFGKMAEEAVKNREVDTESGIGQMLQAQIILFHKQEV